MYEMRRGRSVEGSGVSLSLKRTLSSYLDRPISTVFGCSRDTTPTGTLCVCERESEKVRKRKDEDEGKRD